MSMSLGGRTQRAEINVTPLIDVLLVLLIIFMLITPQIPQGMNAAVPRPAQPAADPPAISSDLVITVCADHTVRLNKESIDLANLAGRLTRFFQHNLNHPIFLKAEPGLEFGQIAIVIDIARGAGLTRVALLPR